MNKLFTEQERDALYAPFDIAQHETRYGYKSQGVITWFVYVRREAIQQRLDTLFFGEWELTYKDIIIRDGIKTQYNKQTKQNEDVPTKYVDVTASLTIRGVTREYNGTSEAQGEHDAKSAMTDAFKRVASMWGIGLYLQNCGMVQADNGKQAHDAMKRELANYFTNDTSPQPAPPQPTPQNKSLLPDGMQTTTPLKGAKWTKPQLDQFIAMLNSKNVSFNDFMYQNYKNVTITKSDWSKSVNFGEAMKILESIGGA